MAQVPPCTIKKAPPTKEGLLEVALLECLPGYHHHLGGDEFAIHEEGIQGGTRRKSGSIELQLVAAIHAIEVAHMDYCLTGTVVGRWHQ